MMHLHSLLSRRSLLAGAIGGASRDVLFLRDSLATSSSLLLTADKAVGKTAACHSVPSTWREIWSDNFTVLSLRTGGPSLVGLTSGTGVWSAAAPWYGFGSPKGWEGYGNDWFIDPFYPRWPASYPKFGQFAITPEGLRIRAQSAPSDMAVLLPAKVKGAPPWISGQLGSSLSVRIKPPFYFEARARMPAGRGRPWPAIWLCTSARQASPHEGMEYEIDVHEGFGDSTRLHCTLHWTLAPAKQDYPSQRVTDADARTDLSDGFNTWGCLVLPNSVAFYFNGEQVGKTRKPQQAYADQPFGIILDVSAGLPWEGPPSGGPHDMIVRYVKLYAPDASLLTLNGVK